MNLKPINPTPENGLHVQCCRCHAMGQARVMLADLDGPHNSFYHIGCAEKEARERGKSEQVQAAIDAFLAGFRQK